MKDVLIVTPIDERKFYCFNDYLRGVILQDADILLVDTSINRFYKDKIGSRIKYMHIGYVPKKFMDRVVKARNKGAEYAIKNRYGYIFWVDADIILEDNVLEKLLNRNKDIVAAVYRTIENRVVHNIVSETGIRIMKDEDIGKGLIKAIHTAMGCTLVKTDVHKKVKFRCEREKNGLIKVGEDYCFCVDCYTELNIQPYVDSNIVVKHVPDSKWLLERI